MNPDTDNIYPEQLTAVAGAPVPAAPDTDSICLAQDLGVAVVMPAYNHAQTLLSGIRSMQSFCRDIIVVNDGSTDQTAKILSETEGEGITVLTHDRNRGKGNALKTGLLFARQQGYRYVVTIDADRQHDASDFPLFLREIRQAPDTLLVGARNLNAANMPAKNSFANKFSNFWFYVETGIRLEDTQSGYRLYPLQNIGDLRYYPGKYEFELAILVFQAWKGVPVRNIPVSVWYPPEGKSLSHFRPFRDFTRISILNTVLVLLAFIWGHPVRFFRKLSRENIRDLLNREIFRSKEPTRKIVPAIMLGVFMGIIPIWGYQMIATALLAHALRLNKIIALIASNISIPPMIPLLLYGSYATGCLVTSSPLLINLTDITLEKMQTVLFQYIAGSFIFAAACS